MMKTLVTAPPPPPLVHNVHQEVRELFRRYVVPTYGRFDVSLMRGRGSEVWDAGGRRYIDMGGGIAVCSLGHCHPAITEALVEQSQRLVHVSNLYYHEPQGRLAERIVRHLGPGKVFFSNSGAEANEGLFKLARRFGHEEGRYEILTAVHSFHGRTLAGIAATGQDKVKKGFGPPVPGFRHVPYNDLAAIEAAVSPSTVAVMIEGIQGEGGITAARPDYLLGLRRLCDEHRLLLLMDGVQCGHFRSGRFQSFQRILEGMDGAEGWLPDGVAMAKSLGGGFPMGAFWVRQEAHGVGLADLLGAGSHGTTYGGTPLGCAVALRIFDVLEREGLADHVRSLGASIEERLRAMVNRYPRVLRSARGLGFMQGLEFQAKESVPVWSRNEAPVSMQMVERLHAAGVLTIPSGTQILRLLPALNLPTVLADEALAAIEDVVRMVDGA